MIRWISLLNSYVYCLDDWKSLNSTVNPGLFYLKHEYTAASGFFIGPNGLGLSVHHFIDDAKRELKKCKLVYRDEEYEFSVVSYDKEADLLIVKAKKLENNAFLRLSKLPPRIGERVCLYGVYANNVKVFEPGYILNTEFTKLESTRIPCYLSSCKGGFGYSGGPVLNQEGLVVSMHFSISTLWGDIFDSASMPSTKIISVLNKVAKETENGWVLK
ncbi:unnamed protein product [Blepharisma stoltei]|uniref:Serine protease n=1 Tax=Blepharisma stoltei TaxID=1481888 RepID=A0AAU9KGD7_9CILI|nr:unnamed protein product [Blepharisma stoltei]